MSNLATILQRHEHTEYFSAKVLQDAARHDSPSQSHNLIAKGSKRYERGRTILRRLPTQLQHDILNDLTDGLPFTVTPRDAASGNEPPLRTSARLVRDVAALNEDLLIALADNRIDNVEDGRIEVGLNEAMRLIAELRQAKNKRRGVVGRLG